MKTMRLAWMGWRLLVACLGGGSALAQNNLLEVTNSQSLEFPMSLVHAGLVDGEVRVVVAVDAGGNLVDALVTAYSHPRLRDAVLAQVPQWSFQAARHQGQAHGSRREFIVRFEARGVVISRSFDEHMLATLPGGILRRYESPPVRPHELDQSLRQVRLVPPDLPSTLLPADPEDRRVMVDFYVDEAGRPRLASVVGSAPDLLAQAAIEAINAWRFEPPLRRGRAVVVRVRQEVIFHPATP